MTDQRAPAILVFSLLFAAILLTFTVFGMLAPLLVGLAAEFQTSVAEQGSLRQHLHSLGHRSTASGSLFLPA